MSSEPTKGPLTSPARAPVLLDAEPEIFSNPSLTPCHGIPMLRSISQLGVSWAAGQAQPVEEVGAQVAS